MHMLAAVRLHDRDQNRSKLVGIHAAQIGVASGGDRHLVTAAGNQLHARQ